MIYIDIETRSELDLEEVGSYKYLNHKSTEIILCAYAFGEGPINLWKCLEQPMPDDLREGLLDPWQTIIAHNSSFERTAFRTLLGITIPVERFDDTMIRARYLSLPGSLEKIGNILDIQSKKLTEFFIKDESMVGLFCIPLRVGGYETLFGLEPTTYRDKDTHPKEWDKFCEYCIIDVEAMREIYKKFSKFQLPEFEYELFALNEKINDTGIYVDPVLLQGTMIVVDKEFDELRKQFQQITGIAKPKSPKAVLKYARANGYTFQSINKVFVNRALAGECNLTDECKKALKLRMQLGKSSVTKLESIKDAVEPDGRVRGLFNFMGAARTGRWTSGLVQLQNLVKATKEVEKKYDLALQLLKKGDYDAIKKEFTSPIDVACAAIRPVFRAPRGKKFIISDLSAIETRGTAWATNCNALMKIFRDKDEDGDVLDPYIYFASLMDPTKTYAEIKKLAKIDKKIRNDAKPPMLGCGYGLTPGEIKKDDEGNIVKTGLLGYGSSMGIDLNIEYAEKAVEVYRTSYKEVEAFWYALHRAFVDVVEKNEIIECGPLVLEKTGRVVRMWLPSGRALHYINPRITYEERTSRKGNPYKASIITIEGIDQKTHQWADVDTYGAKLFENAIQAICRDILGCGMIEADKRGFNIVLTCHDEIVAEVEEDSELTVKNLEDCMSITPHWAENFLIGAAGFETNYYRKD